MCDTTSTRFAHSVSREQALPNAIETVDAKTMRLVSNHIGRVSIADASRSNVRRGATEAKRPVKHGMPRFKASPSPRLVEER